MFINHTEIGSRHAVFSEEDHTRFNKATFVCPVEKINQTFP